jgi:hypothetical protein
MHRRLQPVRVTNSPGKASAPVHGHDREWTDWDPLNLWMGHWHAGLSRTGSHVQWHNCTNAQIQRTRVREWTGLLPGLHQWHLGAGRRPMSGVDVDPGPRLACGLCYCSVDRPDEGKLVWEWWEWYSLAREKKVFVHLIFCTLTWLLWLLMASINQQFRDWFCLLTDALQPNPIQL